MFGYNVASTEGAEWIRHRKITSRAFSEPNMKMVWKQTARIVQEMFDFDWSHRGDVFAIDDVMDCTSKLSMLVIIAAGFGQDDQWIHNGTPSPGHLLTFRQALEGVTDNLILRLSLPPWVWGSRTDRDSLAIAGIAGRGWLGKQAWHAAVAFAELGKYLREMLRDELSKDPNQAPGKEYGNLSKSLVEGLVNEGDGIPPGKNDIFGNMFIFLAAGYETTANALGYALALLALDEVEQQQLYDHIKGVLQDREPGFEDVPKLTRVLAVFFETLRLYPATSELTRYVEEDTTFSVSAALSESDAADFTTLGGKELRRTEVVIPKGSEVKLDLIALHHNPRYWPDPHEFRPGRFMDPNWPRDAFLPFFVGSRSCVGRRFGEVEAITIITLIIRRYKVLIDPVQFPDVVGESKLQRRERLLKSTNSITITPCGAIPLIFTRR
ncbi:hypothetical protein FRB93_012207 [Tulasnella sp. JGI-2019a]|nr:hypothetical protein FRB93_012207 [Tulasnella sp. JGI-2019a]